MAIERADTDILKEWAVYPGHPITLAYLIFKIYASSEAANANTKYNWPEAVGDGRIPGAGGNVYNALYFLRILEEYGFDLERAFKVADECWAKCDSQAKGGYEFVENDDGEKEVVQTRCLTQRERYINRWKDGQEQADKVKKLFKVENNLRKWWN